MKRTALGSSAIGIALGALAILLILVPIAVVVINSFDNPAGAAKNDFVLDTFQPGNYPQVLIEGNVARAVGNGFLVALAAIAGIVVLAAPAGYVLGRNDGTAALWIRRILAIGLIAPLQFIPEIKVLQFLGLSGSYAAVILIHVATWLPLATFLFAGAVRTLPKSLDEAASLDGCNPLTTFTRIIFPLMRPMTTTVILLVFASVWNDFQVALYFFSSQSQYTMPLTLFTFAGYRTSDLNLVFADVVLTLLPIVILFLFAQRYIVAGLTEGANRA